MDIFHDPNRDIASEELPSDERRAGFPPLPLISDSDQPLVNFGYQISQNDPAKPTTGQLSKETWESLKPLIRTLYMEDGGSLARVRQYLSDEYGFLPTKKQLTQRFHSWGFQKNQPRKSKSVGHGGTSKLVKSKPQRKGTGVAVSSNEGIPSRTPSEPIDADMNRWPFADLDLDVVGSPELSRLVEALELETYGEVSPLDLSPSAISHGTELLPKQESQIVSLHQHHPNKSQNIAASPNTDTLSLITPIEARQLPNKDAWSIVDYPNNLLSHFPQHSHLPHEIDPFPTISYTSRPRNSWQIGKRSFNKVYPESINAIVAMLHPNENPRWPQMIERQADDLFGTKQFKQAETLYRKLLASYERAIGSDSIPALDSSRRIAMALFHQGKYKEADKFYGPVHARIIAKFPAEHVMVQDSLTLKSGIASFTGSFNEEAALDRQLAQIDLCHYGPRHRNTVESLRCVAIALQNTGYCYQGEKLLYTVIQLFRSYKSQWQYTDKENYGRAFQNLCKAIYMQGRYEDCEKVCQEARQEMKLLLGIDHDITLCLDFRLATIWKKMGIRYAECEALLRETLGRQRTVYAAINAATIDTIQELAQLLTTLGRHNEATEFYEQVFWNDLDTYGPDHSYTFGSFTELGASYDFEGRWNDTSLLANDYVKQISNLRQEDNSIIKQVQQWLDERAVPPLR